MESLGEIAVTAQRNRRIKKILSTHFGKGKVRVRGHGADWVSRLTLRRPALNTSVSWKPKSGS
jgi:hypothetical protein